MAASVLNWPNRGETEGHHTEFEVQTIKVDPELAESIDSALGHAIAGLATLSDRDPA
jgi:hypothetical protein